MGNSKRLLFVVTQADWGGAQTFIFRAAAEAMRRGYEVLLAYGGTGALAERCREAGVPHRQLMRMQRSMSPLHDIRAVQELVALMREWKPDIALLNSSKAGVVGSVAGRIARVPRIVYRIGGWSFNDPVSPAQKRFRIWMEKTTAAFKDAIIVNTPDGVEQAQTHHIRPRGQVALVPNGIDLQSFDAALKPREDARQTLASFLPSTPDADAPILLTIANFYPAKGLPVLLDALAIVAKRRPDARTVIIGDGEGRAALETQRRVLGLETIVALPGQRMDAATLLRGADLFILPSVKEGFPWALLESMAAGTACVATNVGGVRWMAEDAVRVVPPDDPQAIADAVLDALADREATRIAGIAGRRVVEQRFQEHDMWEKLFAVLNA